MRVLVLLAVAAVLSCAHRPPAHRPLSALVNDGLMVCVMDDSRGCRICRCSGSTRPIDASR